MTASSIARSNIELANCKKSITSHIILRTIHSNHAQASLNSTIHQITIITTIYRENARLFIVDFDKFTRHLIKMVQLLLCKCTNFNNLPTSIKITIFVETICLAIDFLQHIVCPLIAVRTIEILDISIFSCMPYTIGQVTFIVKYIGNASTVATCKCICTSNGSLFSPSEIVPDSIYKVPASLQFTGDSITITFNSFIIEFASVLGLVSANASLAEVIIETFHELYTSQRNTVNIIGITDPTGIYNTIGVGLTISVHTVEELAAFAFQHTIGNDKVVALRIYNSTPYNRRVTFCTPSSASITIFGTGGIFICYCFCRVYMIAVRLIVITAIIFQIYTISVRYTIGSNIRSRECVTCTVKILYNAILRLNVNRQRRSANIVTFPRFNSVIMLMVITGYIVPYTNRQTCQGCSTCSRNITVTCKCKSYNVFCLIICCCEFPFTSKSTENSHVIQFPVIHTVKVKFYSNGLNRFNSICLNVDPINRAIKHILKFRILRYYVYGIFIIIRIHSDLSANLSIVTLLITNTHTDSMCTVCKIIIINADYAIFKSTGNCFTVDICYSCRIIKTGSIVLCHIIFNFSCKRYDM